MNIPSMLKTTVTAAALGTAALLTGCAATTAGGGDVVRYKTPGSTFPIAAAVEIPTDAAPSTSLAKCRPWWTSPSPQPTLRPMVATPKARPWACSRALTNSSRA